MSEWRLLPDYSMNQLIDMAKAGWESILDSYLAPFTWITAIITILVVLGLGFTVLAKAGKAAGGAFIALGFILALFTWWQIPYAVMAGLAWFYVLALAILIAGLALTHFNIWVCVPVALGVALFTGVFWLYPEMFTSLLWI